MAYNPLQNYHILLADQDIQLLRVLRSMLADMGFTHCEMVTSGRDAYRALLNRPYDFLITEWQMGNVNGIELLGKLRRSPDSPNPTLPVIMLTGRAEYSDVVNARDHGVNEFVVKPFSAKAIYNRIERLIEHPRQFVISSNFVGPTRRIKNTPPAGIKERRLAQVKPQIASKDVHGALKAANVPRVWLPDFSLKYKLGTNVRLDQLITDSVLQQAQAAVDAISDESLLWVKDNLADIKSLLARLEAGENDESLIEQISDLALTINSRAGTFGYERASEIAYLLYLFCRCYMKADNTAHHQVAKKHVDVLHVILGNQMKGSAGELGNQMVVELKKLAEKFSE